MDTIFKHLFRTVIWGGAFFGSMFIAAMAPNAVLLLWGLWYLGDYLQGQQVLEHAATGQWPEPHGAYDVPGPVQILDGPINTVHAFSISSTLVIAAVLFAVGMFFGRNWRWGLGMVCLWLPAFCMSYWDVYVGLSHYYPGGRQAYYKDHWHYVCQRAGNGNVLVDKDGREICTSVMVKTPPF